MLGPALRALHENLPRASITLLASPAGSQVAPLLPWVNEVMKWRAIWQDVSGDLPLDPRRELDLISALRKGNYDAAFLFTSFTQSAFPPAYACYLAGIPFRIGYSTEFGGGVLTDTRQPPPVEGHQVDRNLALVELAGLELSGKHLELHIPGGVKGSVERKCRQLGMEPEAAYILAAPGASCAARRYDMRRFAKVVQMLADQSTLPVVIAGSAKEAGRLEPVLQTVDQKKVFSLVGKTSIPELAALIQNSSLVIANNSASLHMADAFNRPMVILYSGTEYESQWMPRTSRAHLLRRPTDCSPCFRFDCPYSMECLDIPPSEVVEAAMDLLEDDLMTAEKPESVLAMRPVSTV